MPRWRGWQATVSLDGISQHLGYYDTKELAQLAEDCFLEKHCTCKLVCNHPYCRRQRKKAL